MLESNGKEFGENQFLLRENQNIESRVKCSEGSVAKSGIGITIPCNVASENKSAPMEDCMAKGQTGKTQKVCP